MTQSRLSLLHGTTGRALLICIALLLCILTLPGCTQPVITAPTPAQTTPIPVATTQTHALPLATTVQTTTTGGAYLSYTNTQYGFSISYPASWSVQENTGGSVAAFTAPSSGMGDVPATMKISVEDLSMTPTSLAQFRAAQLAKVQGLQNYNLIYDDPYKDLNGWKVGYTYLSGSMMRSFVILTIRGSQGYTISFTSRDDQFAAYTVLSDTMFKSFKFA